MSNAAILPTTLGLRDKIGQMLIIGFEGKTIGPHAPIKKAIEEVHIGGVILFDYHYQHHCFDKNIENPEQVRQLNHALQMLNKTANHHYHRPNLPLLISVDYEGGHVNRLKEAYGFPPTYTPADVGKMRPEEAAEVVYTMANTLRDAGFNLNFSPLLDLNLNPSNPIIGQLERSFSDDPEHVARYGLIYAAGFRDQGIQCAYKHFPGHGSATADSHLGFVDVTPYWQPSELVPYERVFAQEEHCSMVMTAHVINRRLDSTGLPATMSYAILTELLRQQLGFNGVIITDDMQMKAITDHYGLEQAVVLAINAGADMLIFGNQLTEHSQDPAELVDIIESNVNAGRISLQRINDAYEHIVNFKNSLPTAR